MYNIHSCSLFLILLFLSASLSSSFSIEKPRILSQTQKEIVPVLLSLNSFKSKYVIDDVLDLLKNLVEATQTEIDTLNNDWKISQSDKNTSLNEFSDSYYSQNDICSDLWSTITDLNDTISELQEEINEANATILANKVKIENLFNGRCDSNANYITSIKNNKKVLNLIAILREAVNQFNESLIQRKGFQQIHSKLILLVNRYALERNAKMSRLQIKGVDVPDVQERTEEEIGTGHVDNTQEELTLEDFDSESLEESLDSIKTKLLNILTNIETQINSDTETYENNEISANEKAAAVKLNLDTEITILNNQIAKLQDDVDENIVELENLRVQWNDCQSTLNSFKESLDAAQNDFSDSTDKYTNELNKLTEELNLFKEVLEIYQTQVASTSTEYKARVDDYSDDQTFNNGTDFKNREIYNVMNGTNANNGTNSNRTNSTL